MSIFDNIEFYINDTAKDINKIPPQDLSLSLGDIIPPGIGVAHAIILEEDLAGKEIVDLESCMKEVKKMRQHDKDFCQEILATIQKDKEEMLAKVMEERVLREEAVREERALREEAVRKERELREAADAKLQAQLEWSSSNVKSKTR